MIDHSDGREARWLPAAVEQAREGFLEELLRERDAFVYSNEEIIIESLEQSGGLTIIDDPEVIDGAPVTISTATH